MTFEEWFNSIDDNKYTSIGFWSCNDAYKVGYEAGRKSAFLEAAEIAEVRYARASADEIEMAIRAKAEEVE